MTGRNLILTADDFGAAPEVNAAVEMAHRQGVLTAASLMVTGAAAEGAVACARRNPSLAVGLHLVLVEGRPAHEGPAADLLGDPVVAELFLVGRRIVQPGAHP